MIANKLWFLPLVIACSSSPDYVGSAHANVVGDRLEIEVFGDADTVVTIPGQPPKSIRLLQGIAKPVLSLDRFPDGPNTLDLEFAVRGKSHVVQVTFTKPPGATGPFMKLADSCGYPSGGSSSDHARLDAGEHGLIKYCWLWSDGKIRIRVKANRGATIAIGDVSATVGADGHAELAYPIRSILLRAPVRTAIGDGAGISEEVPMTLTKGNDKLAGKLLIDLSGDARDIAKATFKNVAAGIGIAVVEKGGAAKPLRPTRQSLVYLPSAGYRVLHYGKATSVAEVGLVAVGRDVDSRPAKQPCGPYTGKTADDGMAPRNLVDIEVDLFDAATGEKVGMRAFEGNYEECPMMAMSKDGKRQPIDSRPEDKVVERWLAQIAEKGVIP